MLDPRILEEREAEIRESIRKRRARGDLDAAIAAHARATAAQTELNEAGQLRNEHAKAGKRKLEDAERERHNAEGKRLKQRVGQLEEELKQAQAELEARAGELPNFLHAAVPEGGEEDFALLHTWGEPASPDFEVRDHMQLAELHDLVDFETAARVTGTKFYYLKNEAVLLELALQRYALDVAMSHGFVPHTTPDLARPEILDGTGYNPRGEETQIYSIANEELCLVGTAEVTLGGMHAGQVLDAARLPLKHAGISHCFRTEAGSHGRESKGLYRVHQFTKVEMFVTTRPEDSEDAHAELLEIEEKIFQGLEIPYRVIDVASADLGAPAYRKFDIEAWMPGRGEGGAYGEVTSASNCTDYQARRLKIRFKREGAKKTEFTHTLNGTAIAISRALIPLLENHQRADGSIAIPEALRPYMGRDVIERR